MDLTLTKAESVIGILPMAGPPHVLLIHCHDLGRCLNCYGFDAETPNIDAIAENGAMLEDHFVTAPQCSPSRSSLMTGEYPHVNGMMGLAHEAWELDDDITTLPEYLTRAGYETHLFGLQHITSNPGEIYDVIHSEYVLTADVLPSVHEADRATDVSKVVCDFLKNRTHSRPFFASVGFFELHRLETEDGGYGFNDGRYDPADPDEVTVPPYLPDTPAVREDIAELHGMLTSVDAAVGDIRDTLAETGMDEETLLIFTTEHGIAFPRAKATCYDAGIEAALLLEYPDRIEAGQTHDVMISNVDVLPTILDLCGQIQPDAISGRSFRPLLEDDDYQPRERVFAEMTWHDMYVPMRTIRTPDYKYIRNFWHLPHIYLSRDIFRSKSGRAVREEWAVPSRPYEELYDLSADPLEEQNLVGDDEFEPTRRRLRDELFGWMVSTDDPLLAGPVRPADYHEMMPTMRLTDH